MSTLQAVELGVLGPLQVRRDGAPVMIPGAKPRAILTMLGLHGGSVVSAETLIELLWGDDPPRTAAKALQTHISSLRRTLGDGFVLTAGTGWTLAKSGVDASRYKSTARLGRDAAAAGDTSQAVSRFEEALALWRGIPELPDGRRGTSEKTRWSEGHAALVEDRADALLVTGRAAEIIGELEAAVADAPLRERRWGQLMLALYRAGRQGEALGAYQRARALLADELGVDPGPDLRRLEVAIVGQDTALEIPAVQDLPSVTRTVTFLLTDIEGSTAAWEADAGAMAVALARHDELVEQVVTSRGGRLIKTRGEGDATFSVFERASAAAAAAIELQDAIFHEPWGLQDPMRIRVALHTGEVELRDGDYFGRAVNRAARLRSLAIGGQILCSGAIAELVVDSLSDDVVLADLGMRQLRNLARPEHVFELRLETASDVPPTQAGDEPLERPGLPAVLTGPGPFVGRGRELEGLVSAWQTALAGGTHAVLIAGEPGVGKTRLAGEWSQQAYQLEAIVLYGRCDEDLGAPYQPFAEALRSLVPCLATSRLRGMRGVEALLTLVPGLTEVLPDLAAPTRADPETERYALFDAVVALLELASAGAPVVLILDDLHWAAKPTLLLLRHLLRFGDRARVQIVGTYRSTDLDRSHPLAAMLADLHRGAGSGTANRLALSGLDEADVTAYVTEAGYNDEELARALASVTGGNPFFLIEALRHVDETGGVWDPTTLPQGVRETVSRRLSRLPAETNTALAAAAVVGSRFALDLVEKVVEQDLVDAFDEACKAGIVIEEPGGRYRFNHAIVRQSLLAELPSVRRMRLHQRIAATLEAQPGADDELLAELAHHYFECAWAGNAAKAVEYCRRAADQAVARLGYEAAADLYGQALHALEEIDDELPDRADQAAELLVARCEALLAAGDVTLAVGAVSQLQTATVDSARLAAWATCFDGELSMLIHPERLDEVEAALDAAAQKLAELDDAAGEAKAHTVRAACLARLGRIGDGEIALDDALTAARRARDHRRVNAVLAGAPLAALWGPNPVPRAGGRCLDVVRLLRITTDSPAVEATSTRCQAVLEAFRGRGAAARRMIDSARRTVTELGLRHALLEVEQFAGIVELIVDDPAAAEPHFRQAYNGFRRMGLDADTAETAALLGRTCLALDRDTEADELCLESERLAGHALKASIAWRTLRARLLSRGHEHGEARRIAEAAVALAERTDALVDHGDSCLTLATVLGAAGDAAGARTAAERAVDLYERKGAAALAERARRVVGERDLPSVPAPPEAPPLVELDNACIRSGKRLAAAINRGAWDEFEQLYAPEVFSESRRKVIGFTHAGAIVPPENWAHEIERVLGESGVHVTAHDIAVRGERLALARLVVGTADGSPGAPQDEFLQMYGIDEEGRISLQIWFDLEDIDAAIAELDAMHAWFDAEAQRPARRLENAASRVNERFLETFATHDWDAIVEILAADLYADDRRPLVGVGIQHGRDAMIRQFQTAPDLGVTQTASNAIATRGADLILTQTRFSRIDEKPDAFGVDLLHIVEINADERIAAIIAFDSNDFDAALQELDARYVAGEAAPHSHMWSLVARAFAAINRHELPELTPDWVNIDHRRGAAFAPGDMTIFVHDLFEDAPDITVYIEAVHRLSNLGVVVTHRAHGTSQGGFEAEWRGIGTFTFEGDLLSRCELFDEADLDAALAEFDQLSRPARRLENTARLVIEHFLECFVARDWDALREVLADDMSSEDRRRVVNAGTRQDRDAELRDFRLAAELGVTRATPDVIATRGERLVLIRSRLSRSDEQPEAFHVDLLWLVQVDAEDRIASWLTFDPDGADAAFAELDARYLAGEGAAHARTWSVIAGVFVAHNRREVAAATPDAVSIDHRLGAAFAPGQGNEYIRAGWDLDQTLNVYIEQAHRVNDLGAVFTYVGFGTSHEGFDAEWRGVEIMTVDGDLLSRAEVFDEADIDTALTKFDQLSRPAPRLENAASLVSERYMAHFAARDWNALAEVLADDILVDDRRRVVNAGIKHGRDAEIANLQAAADVGIAYLASVVIAARGQRLILARVWGGEGGGSGEFLNEVLGIVEINSDNQHSAIVLFELDDFDAAIAELDARYLAGEAAAHANVLQPVMDTVGELNRHKPGPMLGRLAFADHRRVPFGSAEDYGRAIEELWTLVPDARYWTKAVHALNAHGLVSTLVIEGTDAHGNELQWGRTFLFLSDGPQVEVYEEDGVEAALARFEELRPQARRLENAASQVAERYSAHFAARDWDALAKVLADDIVTDDRRRVANAGIRHGRDADIANLQATAGAGFTYMAPVVIAARGEHLILARTRVSGGGGGSAEVIADTLGVVEINSHNQVAAIVVFEVDDFESALAELDARYLAGEGAPYAHTWSVVTGTFVAVTRHELPALTPDCVTIDHRRVTAFAPGEMTAYIRAGWEIDQTIRTYAEVVHRLSDLGAICTYAAHGVSREGFDGEWSGVNLATVDGDMVNRSELFDETDVDTAIARFEQLTQPAPRLENAASQVYDRVNAYFSAGDWAALSKVLAQNMVDDDRRRTVNHGIRRGRDAEIANSQAVAEAGADQLTSTVIATRGGRLALCRTSIFGRDQQPGAFRIEFLSVVEIDADEQEVAHVAFEFDDFDAALAELDARHLAGEAAAYARVWSVIMQGFASLNRHEIPPTTPDWVNIDHRRLGRSIGTGEMPDILGAAWNVTSDLSNYIEAVHRLNNVGAVMTHVTNETSQEGFHAEWRVISLVTLNGDLVNRCEVFDEEDLDAAIARFEELHPPTLRLENTATRVQERVFSYIAAGDWDAVAQITAENVSVDDRRRVVNAGVLHGRDANIESTQATVDVGFTMTMVRALATRGEYLALFRVRVSGRDAETIQNDALNIVEIDADERIAGNVVFDLDDFDAALAELDARYLAGEAAAHADTWSVIAGVLVAHNRREIAAVTTDAVSLDHRRGAAFAPGEGFEYVRAGWDLGQDINIYTEIAHRLNDLGAVITWAAHGTSHEGFVAEWRGVTLMTVDGEMVSRMEVFDEGDLDAALARFEELSRPAPRMENTASQVTHRFLACFAAREWDAMPQILGDIFSYDDRRRVVGSGVRYGGDAHLADMRASADLWTADVTPAVMATRGERLVLAHLRFPGRDQGPEAFVSDVLGIVEINVDERMVAFVSFELDDFDAAIAELDARYLAGEAAPYRDAWSVIVAGYAALNRYEVPPSAPDYVNIDHRLRATFEAADLGENLRAAWDLTPKLKGYIEVVHRLSGLGTVVTHAAHGTTKDGLIAEWRGIQFLTLEDGMVNRCEIFDEADLDSALTRFEDLQRQAPRLENAACRVGDRFLAHFVASEWDAMAEMLADNHFTDDRRRVVGAGVRRGREAQIADFRTLAGLFARTITVTAVATRGERLALRRARFSDNDHGLEAFVTESLTIGEIDADERIVAFVTFDVGDTDAAFAELEARFLAGDAAAHAHTWSVITQAYAALNRRELPATTRDWTSIDHRGFGTIEANALTPNIRAFWDITSNARIDVATVHRLTDLGAVVAHATHATSREDVEIESGEIIILTVDGDRLSRCEIFDEADLDTALARFDELHPPMPRLENAASRAHARLKACIMARDWSALTEILAGDIAIDDRRRVVNSGIQYGRDAAIADMRGAINLGLTNISLTVTATRGDRLELCRMCISGQDRPDAFRLEFLSVVEINADERIVARVAFDPDDIDAAFEELDARYLAGEAAVHGRTWSVIARVYAEFNRHEIPPTTPDSVYIDHRPVVSIETVDMAASIRAVWDLTPDIRFCIDAVHRLSELGAVITGAMKGTSPDGFDAEWQMVNIFTIEGDRLSRFEVFDEGDLDAALARFEELQPQARRLENAASQVAERFWAHFESRDWDAMAEIIADDCCTHDRRLVVNADVLRGRAAHVTNMRAVAEVGFAGLTSTVLATREHRLVLIRIHSSARGSAPGEVTAEMLSVVKIDTHNRLSGAVIFDSDDIDAAFEELDARYLAGEAADYAHTWSVIARTTDAFNRHELPAADGVNIDNRTLAPVDASDLPAFLRDIWDLTPDFSTHIEAVHRLSSFGAVVTYIAYGTSVEGFAAEWRAVDLLAVEGDRISRVELFDEADLDAALARFDELQPQMPRLENAASRRVERYLAHFAAHDWAAFAELLADDIVGDDRRRVVNSGVRRGRDAHIADMRAIVEVSAPTFSSTIIATRGERLALAHVRIFNRGMTSEVGAEALGIGEIDADERIVATISFDLDDTDAAFAELEARYLAGEASDYAHTWSVITHTYAAFNRHELAAADWVTIDHRRLVAIDPNDMAATIRAVWDLTPQVSIHVEAVHRLSRFGAVVTDTMCGTSPEGFDAEWRMVQLLTVEGDRIKRCEVFDEADLDTGLARFDELEQRTASIENAATRTWMHVADAFNCRDMDGLLALASAESRYEDRRKGLRDVVEAPSWRKALGAVLQTAPSSWRMEVEPIAVRGARFSLSRECYRDVDDADRPIAVELLHVVELDAADLMRNIVSFDPDDLDDAVAELTARWIASGEVAYPGVIEAVDRINATINRHDWEAVATYFDGADYVNHRQLAHVVNGTIDDWLSSLKTTGSNSWIEIAEVLARSAIGIVSRMALKGTSTDGAAIELPFVMLMLLHGERVTRLEAFDENQRELALARLQEFNRPV